MRARTTLLAAAVVGVALIAGAVVLVLILQSALTRSGDAAALVRLGDLEGQVEAGHPPRNVTSLGDDTVVQVLDARGDVVPATGDRPKGRTLVTFRPTGAAPVVHTVNNVVADSSERESYRVWAVRAHTPAGPRFVYVATSVEEVAEATTLLRTSLVVGIPFLLALLAFITWLLLGRALRPVEAIRAQVADISEHALDRRVPEPATGDEVSRLAKTMNGMLVRLEAANRRQREFVADASHELQSPLTSLRSQLEVSLAHPTAIDWRATAAGLLADSDRMERIVRDLLYLARSDALPPQPVTTLVDLDDIVLDETQRLRGGHLARFVRFDTTKVSAAPVRGRGDELRRMLRNLLENAARHARRTVRLGLRTTGDAVVLLVEDDGPGIPASDRDRVFERFVRLEEGRSHAFGGTGLGLAIVRTVAERHGGTVWLEPSRHGARFVVRLPPPELQGLARPSS
ncbi:MAG: sensor histidine kinase, partial [Nocardioidaceae bacterium]